MGLMITSWEELKRGISGFIQDQMINPNLTISVEACYFDSNVNKTYSPY